MANTEGLKPPQEVVRGIVVSLAPEQKMWDQYAANSKVDFLNFYVGKKDDRYALLGGRVDPSEGIAASSQREIMEEGASTAMGVKGVVAIGEPYQYSFTMPAARSHSHTEYNDEVRNVTITYIPIQPNKKELSVGEGVRNVETLNINEFVELIESGTRNEFPMEDHAALNQTEGVVNFNPIERLKKDSTFKRVVKYVKGLEQWANRQFESKNAFESEEKFKQVYNQLLARLMTNGFDFGDKKAEGEATKENHTIHQALNGGHLGKDILYFLPGIARNGKEWAGLEEASEATKEFLKYSNDIVSSFCRNAGYSLEYFTKKMQDSTTPIAEIHNLEMEFSKYVNNQVRSDFFISKSQLKNVVGHVDNFYREMSSELKLGESELAGKGIYQDFALPNEIAHVGLGKTLLYFMGLHNMKDRKTSRFVEFAAGRQWLLFLKAAEGINYFDESISAMSNSIIQLAVDKYFGEIVDKQDIMLNGKVPIEVNIRQRNGVRVIVDKKPQKTFTSYLRKMFYDKVEDITDFLAYSISFAEEYGTNPALTITKIGQMKEDFIAYLSEQLVGYKMKEFKQKDTFEVFLSDLPENRPIEYIGTHAGSQDGRIVRSKSVVRCSRIDTKREAPQEAEISWYPFQSLPNNNYWGWEQKTADNASYTARRMLSGSNGIPSFYHLLYPVDLFKANYKNIVQIAAYHH